VFLDGNKLGSREYLAQHGLSRSPFLALVAPRPIGWISTLDRDGRANLAPFSFFNAVSQRPPMVMFCANGVTEIGQSKDTLRNVRETGEFVLNLATWDLRVQMNDTSTPAPHGTDEFEVTGLGKLPSQVVRPPRVAESPVHMECKLLQIVELPADERSGAPNSVTFARVVGVHVDERLVVKGRVDITRARPLARLGYLDYASVESVFEIIRPTWPLVGGKSGGD
jgi:flavin reductase (DIM6/NTAB) family NADH-FMN oxidoreductase RutF